MLKKDRTRSLDAFEDGVRERTENLPGVSILSPHLGMRIDERLGGTPADLWRW